MESPTDVTMTGTASTGTNCLIALDNFLLGSGCSRTTYRYRQLPVDERVLFLSFIPFRQGHFSGLLAGCVAGGVGFWLSCSFPGLSDLR